MKRENAKELIQKLYRSGNNKEFIAYKLGVDASTVWRWAEGKSAPHKLFVKELEAMLEEGPIEKV